MDNTVKRRLVGALVIVLLAIILVPAWLDGSARRLRDEDAFVVPLPPPDNRKPLVEAERIGEQLEAQVPTLEPLPEPSLKPPEQLADAGAAADSAAAPQAPEAKAPAPAPAPVPKATAPEPEAKPKPAPKPAPKPKPVPETVEVDLGGSTGERSGNTSGSGVVVEVAESARREQVDEPRANWIVQVGSFASKRNAEAMVARLKKGGLKAFMREFQSSSDVIYRVLVGPFVRQTEADEAKRTIDRRFQVKSFVANWRG